MSRGMQRLLGKYWLLSLRVDSSMCVAPVVGVGYAKDWA
jgi:hypothetical protein